MICLMFAASPTQTGYFGTPGYVRDFDRRLLSGTLGASRRPPGASSPQAGATRGGDGGFERMVAERAEHDRRREVTRWHEAGHGAVARALGLDVDGVTVDPAMLDADTCGRTLFTYPAGVDPETIAVVALAGAAAARLAPGHRPADDMGDADDESRACLALGVPTVPAHVRRRVEELVTRHRDGIARVADALRRSPTLIGDDVEAIMAGSRAGFSPAAGSVTVDHRMRSHVHHGHGCGAGCRWREQGYAA